MEILTTHVRATGGAAGTNGGGHDVADLFRAGRVLTATVLEATSTGQVLLGIGRQRVLADTPAELEVGRHLLLRVAAGKNSVVLDVLGVGSEESALLRTLRAVLGQDRPMGELLHELAERLRASGDARAEQLSKDFASHVFRPGAGGAALKELFAKSGLCYEAALCAALSGRGRGPLDAESLSSLLSNLKAQLLAELDSLPDGPLREAVSRALAGLEAEQLLNLARREAGEPLHFSIPVPDGAHAGAPWTTAHVFWHPKEDRSADGDASDGEARHLSVGVTFQRIGPIRIDVWMRPDGVSLRLFTEREDIAERMRVDLPLLAERIALCGRPVQIVVGVAARDVVELEQQSMDIRYLREHRVMDVTG